VVFKRRLTVLALALLVGCVPPESTCTERDISAWVPSTAEFATPIRCDGKIVGYDLDIDSSKDMTSRTWAIAFDGPHPGGVAAISADIDMLTPTKRVATLYSGSTQLAEVEGVLTTVSASSASPVAAGPLQRAFAVTVPAGLHYRGQIRNMRW